MNCAMRQVAYDTTVLMAAVCTVGMAFVTTVLAQEAAPPRFIDERRLPDFGQQEAARRAAEVEAARKRAEEEERARQAAEAERKAAEEKAEIERVAEQERARRAAEAAREAAEEEALRQNAEETARARQAAEATAAEVAREQARERKAAAEDLARRMAAPTGPCKDVQLDVQPRPAGRLELKLASPCLSGRNVTLSYEAYDFVRTVDGSGQLTFVLDLFAGKAPLSLKQEDGTKTEIDVSEVDLKGLSKVAVLWTMPVNLDLHATEYLASRGGEGHVWSKSPASMDAALAASREGNRGRGFLSTDDTGSGEGIHAEVYTFIHNPSQKNGAVTLLIDYESRGDVPQGDYCGDGKFAEVEVGVVRLRPSGRIEKEKVRLGPAPCGERLTEATRFNPDTLSDLVARQ